MFGIKNNNKSEQNIEKEDEDKERIETNREGKRGNWHVYLSTRWSLVGCGAMVFLTYW